MSLQGSFETIALTDVMALLASSYKSGELRVVGGQLEGRLWLENGCLVGSHVGKAHGPVEAIFELLCLPEGNFVFKDGVPAPAPEEPTPVEPVVREAEDRLREWRDIERIVPSLEHRVRLIPDLPTPEVTLTADEWRLVMAIALAGTVRGALEELSLSHFDGCRGIRRLVDFGLAIVEPPRVRSSSPDPARLARRSAATAADGALRPARSIRHAPPVPEERPVVAPPALTVVAKADEAFPIDDDQADPDVVYFPLRDDGYDTSSYTIGDEPVPDEPLPALAPLLVRASDESVDVPWGDTALMPETDMASAVAEAAAAASAASARAAGVATTPNPVSAPTPARAKRSVSATPAAEHAERPERPERDAQNDPINRGLLLKFLSSVRS